MPNLTIPKNQELATTPQQDQLPLLFQDNMNAGAHAEQTFIQAKTNFDKQIDVVNQQSTQGENVTTSNLLEGFDKVAGKLVDDAITPIGRDKLGLQLTEYRNTFANRALMNEAKGSLQKRKQSAVDALQSSKTRLTSSPELLGESIQDMERMADFVPTANRKEFLDSAKKDLSKTALSTMISSDPDRAEKEVGQFSGVFDEKEMNVFNKNISIEKQKRKVGAQKAKDTALENLNSIDERMNDGIDFSDDELDNVQRELERSIDTDEDKILLDNFLDSRDALKEKQELRGLDALELSEKAKGLTGETKKFAEKMVQKAKDTPLEHEAQFGTLTVEPLDLNDAATLQKRKGDALFAAKRHNTAPQILTSAEVSQFTDDIVKSSPDDAIGIAQNFKKGFGNAAMDALDQISRNAPIEAHALGMFMNDDASTDAGKSALEGLKMFRERPDLKASLFGGDNDTSDKAFTTSVDDALQGDPSGQEVIQETANAIYASRVSKTGRTQFNQELYDESVRMAVGGTSDPRTGIKDINGKKTILPSGVTDDDFERLMQTLPDNLADVATFERIGPDQYKIMVFGNDITDGAGVVINKDIVNEAVAGQQTE